MKLRSFLLSLTLLLLLSKAFAQKEAAIWYFGNNAGLDFNLGTPIPLNDGELSTTEGSATISDENGLLLFYTDGITVWNRNHEPMPNGEDLFGDPSSTQSAIIIPKPADENLYYIFTADIYDNEHKGINWSEVDMTLNGGLGDIVSKNNNLLANASEKLTAVRHANAIDYWVITHGFPNDEFLAYRIGPTGVSNTPIISRVGFNTSSNAGVFNAMPQGYLKASPDGSKVAIAHQSLGVEVLDFNAETGILSNPIKLEEELTEEGQEDAYYGIEFSPNSQVLYVSMLLKEIYQYNLSASNIKASRITINEMDQNPGGMQLGIDQKIYITNFGERSLSVIENPNLIGEECNYNYATIPLERGVSSLGLPPFIQSLFLADIEVENVCLGELSVFSIAIENTITSILWNFGDGASSLEEMPSHTYQSAGNYTVSVTISIGNDLITETKEITIYDTPVANKPADVELCLNNAADAFDMSTLDEEILGTQSNEVFEVRYYLDEISAQNNTDAIADTFMPTIGETEIFAKIFAIQNPSCYAITNFKLIARFGVAIEIEDQYAFCPDALDLVLDGGDFSSWKWTDGQGNILSEERLFSIPTTGNYSLLVTPFATSSVCGSDTKDFSIVASPTITDFTYRLQGLADKVDVIIQTGVNSNDFEYSIDGMNFQKENVFSLFPGVYTVNVRDSLLCNTVSKLITVIGHPSFFTPNGDGINDFWNVVVPNGSADALVAIYNRQGMLLKQLRINGNGWDGTYLGNPLPASDYWFRFEAGDGTFYQSHFALKR